MKKTFYFHTCGSQITTFSVFSKVQKLYLKKTNSKLCSDKKPPYFGRKTVKNIIFSQKRREKGFSL